MGCVGVCLGGVGHSDCEGVFMSILVKMWRWAFGSPARKANKRLCSRCGEPIKLTHRWTTKLRDDHRPSHWDCAQPMSAVLSVSNSSVGKDRGESPEQGGGIAEAQRPLSMLGPREVL